MPIYEYRCSECQQLFEEWCKHVEETSVVHNCPICKGAAQRIMSNTSFVLKGGGWYVTEYGSHKNVPAEGSSGGDASGGCASGGCAAKADAPCAASSGAACPSAAACGSTSAAS